MEPYLGQIELLALNFAPSGWLACNGQLLQISGNDALFALLGTTYGGDGQNNFALPNLNARVPVGVGNGTVIGQAGGVENATLTNAAMPSHTHPMFGAPTTTSDTPAGLLPAATEDTAGAAVQMYNPTPNASMNASVVSAAGGGQPFNVRNPYLGLHYCICTQGVFPNINN